MHRDIQRLDPLDGLAGLPTLVRDWLSDSLPDGGATDALKRFLAPTSKGGVAPAWSDTAWSDAWWEGFAADLPNETAVAACAANRNALAAGTADVVVTGQQPGFLGGPLYTLYKIATCIAAAERRTSAGNPTVPLFWAGDDDDDLREAFSPRLFDPRRGVMLSPLRPDTVASRMVGCSAAAEAGAGEAAWLAERAPDEPLAADLSSIWTTALREGYAWGRLQRRAILRIFGAHGLLVVSGNDDRLHAAAAPLYETIWPRREALSTVAAARGRELEAAGHHAQIGDESLARPFSLTDGDRRLRLDTREAFPADPAAIRPGVLFRSLVQDWIFQPAGVVVGPGEISYLMQTGPVHEALGVIRPPMLPRLFCRLAGAHSTESVAGDEPAVADQELLERVAESGRKILEDTLKSRFALSGEAATAAADRPMRRWLDDISDLFKKLDDSRVQGEAARPWEHPAGKRQERIMATHWATAVWGEGLVDRVVEAARLHLESGTQGDWRDTLIVIDADRCERK